MKKALVVYHSKTGRTQSLADEIGRFLEQKGAESKVVSVEEFSRSDLEGVDYLLLGSWTNGVLVALQHPERTWVAFARSLPALNGKKIALFTTYLIATGSMFLRMRRQLECEPGDIRLELKSRGGGLSERQQAELSRYLGE